jgi:HK97 family phage portal protein
MTKRDIIHNILGIKNVEQRSSGSVLPYMSFTHTGGTTVSHPKEGLAVSTVYACVDTISKTVATLPSYLVRHNADGDKKKAVDHPQNTLFTRSPYLNVTPYVFKRDLVIDYCLWGNAYALKIYDTRYKIIGYKYIAAYDMLPWRSANNELYYHCFDINHKGVYRPEDVIHIRDIGTEDMGYSKIHLHATTVGKEKAAASFINNFYTNGNFLGGVIEYPRESGTMTPEQIENIRNYFKNAYGGVDKSGQVAIITGGGTLKQFKMDMPLSNAQYVEGSKMNKLEICSIFSVPGPKIGLTEGTPYNSLESLNLDYWQNCILPIVTMIEEEFNLKSFAAEENISLCHNFDTVLRADTAASGEYYTKLYRIGVLNRNEIRERLNLNKIEGGDIYYIEGNNMINPEDVK